MYWCQRKQQKYINTPEGNIEVSTGRKMSFSYYYTSKDHLGSIWHYWSSLNNSRANIYYPSGIMRERRRSPFNYGLTGKEIVYDNGLDEYFFGARTLFAPINRFNQPDPLCEEYYHISPYAYCANNFINALDPDGREWKYVTDANGHITINVALNLSVSGNYTAAQINAYKNAISTQFHNTIYESSGGTMSGTVTFYQENTNIVQSLSLGKMNNNIGGMTSYFNSFVNLYNSAGELRSLSSVGSDATHEMLHTLRLDHPFEITQTADTELLRVAPNSFVSTPTTDKNIVNNIMNYPNNNH